MTHDEHLRLAMDILLDYKEGNKVALERHLERAKALNLADLVYKAENALEAL